jgi:lipopolysaccharide export system permease protein
MTDGHILRRDGGMTEPTQIIAFDKYAVDLDRFEQRTAGPADLKPRERYFSELINPAPNSQAFKQEPGRFRSELHERFSSALYPLAFVLLAIALVGQAQSTRQDRNLRMGFCFLAGVGVRLSGLAMNNVVVLHASAVPVLYLIPLATIVLSMLLIVRGARPSKRSARVERLVDWATAFGGGLRQRFQRRGAAAPAGSGG